LIKWFILVLILICYIMINIYIIIYIYISIIYIIIIDKMIYIIIIYIMIYISINILSLPLRSRAHGCCRRRTPAGRGPSGGSWRRSTACWSSAPQRSVSGLEARGRSQVRNVQDTPSSVGHVHLHHHHRQWWCDNTITYDITSPAVTGRHHQEERIRRTRILGNFCTVNFLVHLLLVLHL